MTNEPGELPQSNSSPPTPTAPPAATPAGLPPPRAGFHYELRRRLPLTWAGIGVFAGAYASSALSAILNTDGYYAIPIGGAFYGAVQNKSKADHACDQPTAKMDCNTVKILDSIGVATSIISGLAQTAGIILVIVGASTKRQSQVADRPSARLAPLTLSGGGGLTLIGEF